MKYAEVHLPYYKQGDDLSHHLEHSESIVDALEGHARQLEHASGILRAIKDMVSGHDVKFDAGTHMIQVLGPDDVIDRLIAADLASVSPWDEEDEDGYEEDEERPTGWDAVF